MEKELLHQKLFAWWLENGRVLPWREKVKPPVTTAVPKSFRVHDETFAQYQASELPRDPYRVVVSELMLQQTQVDRVLLKYEAWMKRWPTITDLANAQLSDVLIEWQGLGYNRRARFLWLLAKSIVHEKQGNWPQTEAGLMELPGIGKYTARAVLAFAFQQQVAVVDTNIRRIFDRVFSFTKLKNTTEYFHFADKILPAGLADPWGQLLMDFGALVCTAHQPRCLTCPVQNICEANLLAQSKGYKNFADKLFQEKTSTPKNSGSQRKPKFETTNRFFRGRIIDTLRQSSLSLQQLQKVLENDFGLDDTERFHTLITQLSKEGLIKLCEQKVTLG